MIQDSAGRETAVPRTPGRHPRLLEHADEKHRYTTKCFTGFDTIELAVEYLDLMFLVGAWAIACRLAWPG